MLIAAIGSALNLASSQQPVAEHTDLLPHELGVLGREVFEVHVDLLCGSAFSARAHPAEEIAYVLDGLLEHHFEIKPRTTLKTGEAFFIPTGTTHSAKNVGTGNVPELEPYFVEIERPLATITLGEFVK